MVKVKVEPQGENVSTGVRFEQEASKLHALEKEIEAQRDKLKDVARLEEVLGTDVKTAIVTLGGSKVKDEGKKTKGGVKVKVESQGDDASAGLRPELQSVKLRASSLEK